MPKKPPKHKTTKPCRCGLNRVACFLCHGEPRIAWWIVFVSALVIVTTIGSCLEARP